MPVSPLRVRQTTATAGVGPLSLDAATGLWRSFQQQFGTAPRRVRIVIVAATGFEVSYGTYDGGNPGIITRETVVASSAGNTLLNLPANAAKECFALPDLDREVTTVGSSATLSVADLGNVVVFTGSSSASASLPSVQTVPPGSGFVFVNSGTAPFTIDPNGAEQVNGATALTLSPGHSSHLLRVGSQWIRFGGGAGSVVVSEPGAPNPPATITKKPASNTTSVDFVLPTTASQPQAFRLTGSDVAVSEDDYLVLRPSQDGGASFSSDSNYDGVSAVTLGPDGQNFTWSLLGTVDTPFPGVIAIPPFWSASRRNGFSITFQTGSGSSPFVATGQSWHMDSSQRPYWRRFAIRRTVNGYVNAVRLAGLTARISGTFLLENLG